MPDKSIRRIQYYTRKVREAGELHVLDPKKEWRFRRLIAYKEEMNRRLEAERLTIKA